MIGKQPPPEVWKEIFFPMHARSRSIHALELASEFLPERKWCRELSFESCEVFDLRTRVVLWNNNAAVIKVEEFLEELLEGVPDSLKLLEDKEEFTTPEGWSMHTTTYEFDLFVAGGHRVCFHKVIFSGFEIKYYQLDGCVRRQSNIGYYQVVVPISLFRQLRSTGCFKEYLLQVILFREHLFQVSLLTVFNSIYVRKNRYIRSSLRFFTMTHKERSAAASLLRS